jgi:hypothetical protein
MPVVRFCRLKASILDVIKPPNGSLESCGMNSRTSNGLPSGRVATRYDKLAANYLAFIKLASIRIWLRANESAPRLVRRS